MRKKNLLTALVLSAILGTSSVAFANPVTDPKDASYVERIVQADGEKSKAEAPKLHELEEAAEKNVTLVDNKAIPEVVALYRYLSATPKLGKVIYGHENDVHHKMFRPVNGSESDTKDVTGSIAGIVGFDSLSFTGDELRLSDCEANMGISNVDKMVEITGKAAKEGAILTLSMHMPNFELVAKKAKVTGHVDYSGYSPHIVTGNVAKRILPDGDLNTVFTGYLDMVADYGLKMQKDGIPVIFRPLHEHNGFWFWWGKEHTKTEDFQKLWEYIVTYLRDTKGVHNFLYAYSPNGPFSDEKTYLDRYPGDAYVDVMGIDSYDDNQTGEWFTNMKMSLGVIQELAQKHKKLTAITEAGIRDGGSLAVSGNKDKLWFSKVGKMAAEYKVPYFMTWSNFEKLPHNFFAPYMVSENRGHEMINEFIDFYNEPETLFADGIVDYRSLGR